MNFYLIRDRDFLTPEIAKEYTTHTSGRMYVWSKYHIENFLLDDDLIAKVQGAIFSKPTTPAEVGKKLRGIAESISAEILSSMIAFRLNLVYRPEDFSLGKFMQGESILGQDGLPHATKVDQIENHLALKVESANRSLARRTDPSAIDALVAECKEEIRQALMPESDQWRSLFPGRRILEEYARLEGLGKTPAFQNSLIKELSTTPNKIPEELQRVIQTIVEGNRFV